MSDDQKKKLKNNLILLALIILLFAFLSRFLQHNQKTLADLQQTQTTVQSSSEQ